MKKTVLLLVWLSCTMLAYAQQSHLSINAPASIAGTHYEVTVAVDHHFNTILPPLSGDLVLAYDSLQPSNLANCACTAFSDTTAIAGKIVLIDGNTCDYNTKVMNAYNAGAIGVVIGSHLPIGVLSKIEAWWGSVIPTISIDRALFNQLKTALLSDAVNLTIDYGYHLGTDLKCNYRDILTSPYAAIPVSELQVQGDAKIYLVANPVNMGTQTINSSAISLNIDSSGTSIYNEQSMPPSTFISRDSAFMAFNGSDLDGTFKPAPNTLGTYTLTYTASANNDEDTTNNVAQTTLQVTNCTMSKAPLQGGRPVCDIGLIDVDTSALYTEWGNLFHIKYGDGYEIRTAYLGVVVGDEVTSLNGKAAAYTIRRWEYDNNANGAIDIAELSGPLAYGERTFGPNDVIPANRIIMSTVDIYDAALNTVGYYLSNNTYYVMTISVENNSGLYIGATKSVDYTFLSSLTNSDNIVYYPSILVKSNEVKRGISGAYYQPSLAFDVCQIPNATCDATFYINPDTLQNGVYYGYNANTNTSAYTYLWDFGDGSTSANPYPVHNYAQPGVYNICLTITSINGNCTDTYCDSSFYSARGLTPNPISQLIIQNTTSTSQVIADNELYINPNPSLGDLTISIDNNTLASLTVLDILGHPILTQVMSGSVYQLDISTLPAGLYLLRVQDADGKTATRRIVKQ